MEGDPLGSSALPTAQRRPLAHPYYFLFFASNAAILPFLNILFRKAGLTAGQIGVIAALRPWLSAPSAYAWGALADRLSLHRLLFIVSFVICVASRAVVAVPQLLFPPAVTFWGVTTSIVLSEMMFNPGMILVDAAVVASLADYRTYGRVRMWGSAGWGVSASIVGTVIDRYGYWAAWGIHWAGSLVTLVVGIIVVPFHLLRMAQAREDEVEEGGGGVAEPLLGDRPGSPQSKLRNSAATDSRNPDCLIASRESLEHLAGALTQECEGEVLDGEVAAGGELAEASYASDYPSSGRNLLEVACAPRVALFLVLVFVWGAGYGVIDAYLFLWLEELHASQKLMGLTLTSTCLAEVPIMFFSDRIIRALGTEGCIHLVMFAFVLRLLAHSSLALWPTTWLVLPVELLHGVTFGLAWACGTVKTAQLSPDGQRASMQGLFQAVYMGVGKGAGALAAGLAYDWFGAAVMFRLAAASIAFFWATTTVLKLLLGKQRR